MKVQIKRDFKGYILIFFFVFCFSRKRTMKKQQVLYEIFLKNEFAAAASILYSVAASFSKNTSTPIYKMVNTLSVDSHLKALKLTSMLHPSIFL